MSSKIPVLHTPHRGSSIGNRSSSPDAEHIAPALNTMQLRSRKVLKTPKSRIRSQTITKYRGRSFAGEKADLQTTTTKSRVRSLTVTKHKGLPRTPKDDVRNPNRLSGPQRLQEESKPLDLMIGKEHQNCATRGLSSLGSPGRRTSFVHLDLSSLKVGQNPGILAANMRNCPTRRLSSFSSPGMSPSLVGLESPSAKSLDKDSKVSATKLFLSNAVARVFQDASQFSPVRSPQHMVKKLNSLHMIVDKENTPPGKAVQAQGLLVHPNPNLHSTPIEKRIRNHYKAQLPCYSTTKDVAKKLHPSLSKSESDVEATGSDGHRAVCVSKSGSKLNGTFILDNQSACNMRDVQVGCHLQSDTFTMEIFHGGVCSASDVAESDVSYDRVPEVLTLSTCERSSEDLSPALPVVATVSASSCDANTVWKDAVACDSKDKEGKFGTMEKSDKAVMYKWSRTTMDNTLVSARRQVTFEEPVVPAAVANKPGFYVPHYSPPKASRQALQDFSDTPRLQISPHSFHVPHTEALRQDQPFWACTKSVRYGQAPPSVNNDTRLTSALPTKLCTHTTTTPAFICPIVCSVMPPISSDRADTTILPQSHPAMLPPRMSSVVASSSAYPTGCPGCMHCSSHTTLQVGWGTVPLHHPPTLPQIQQASPSTQASSDAATDLEVAGLSLLRPAVQDRVIGNPVASSLENNSWDYTFEPIHVPVRTVIQYQGSAFQRIMIC